MLQHYTVYSPNKRSFRGPGGVDREVVSAGGRFLGDSALSLWSLALSPVVPGVVPRGPPLFFYFKCSENVIYNIGAKILIFYCFFHHGKFPVLDFDDF